MIRNIHITIGLLLVISLFAGCVKDGLDECPSGRVNLNLYVERFQNRSQNPLDDREEDFSSRVNHIRYYLYRNGELVEQDVIHSFTKSVSAFYPFTFTDLEYGDYTIALVANCTKTALTGDPVLADNLALTFSTCADTEDFFTAVYPFSVDSNEPTEHEVGLLRTHGVVRYTFNNMPDDISDAEVVVKNVCSKKWITSDYDEVCEASHRYTLMPLGPQKAENDYVIGTFPTPEGEKSAYYLHLYRNNERTPYMERLIADTMSVTRNQLLDIAVNFNGEEIDFEIDLDSKWDGSSDGGQTELE